MIFRALSSKRFILFILIWYISCAPPRSLLNITGDPGFKRKINELISSSELDVSMGIKIVSLSSGETLYGLNNHKLLLPASNNKLYTCAAAIERLGADHVFTTTVLRNGGNLILKGGGDPDLTIDRLDSLAKISVNVIKNVDTLFVDESLMDTMYYGEGWMWDEGSWWYAAPISAMSVNDNCIDFYVDPGQLGGPAKVNHYPITSYFRFVNNSITVNDTLDLKKFNIERDWAGRTNQFTITGEIFDTAKTDTFYRNIHDPALFSGTLFKELLELHGAKIKNILIGNSSGILDTIAVHRSDSLIHSAFNLMNESDNLTAELFIKTMGTSTHNPGNWKDGIDTVKSFLFEKVGIDTSAIQIADGSGVSRYNLSSPDQIVSLLSWVFNSASKDDFISTLPGGGWVGTMEERLGSLGASVRVKTGHISGVSCLSGFAFTQKYGPLAFSMIMNGFIGSAKPYQEFQDKICSILFYD